MRPMLKAALQKVSRSRLFLAILIATSTTKVRIFKSQRIFDKMSETGSKPKPLPITVQKPTPYTFDLGLLLASDPNPLVLTTRENLEQDLAATARDGAQALLNQLLSTCPIATTPNGVLLSLPGIEMPLPREKVCFLLPILLLWRK